MFRGNSYKVSKLKVDLSTIVSISIEEYGRQKALLFQGFALFAYQCACKLSLDTLYFVTREGAFFKAVHESLFPESLDGKALPDTALLEASRQATFGPAVAASDKMDLSRLWNLYPRITPQAFLKSLNLDEGELGTYFERRGLDLNGIIEQPWANCDFVSVL
jgi:hypothetical protein